MSDQLDLLAEPTEPTAPTALWTKERGGGGIIYRTETRFGRIWNAPDGTWRANRRPEPYAPKNPRWEGPEMFHDRSAAEAWVEAPSNPTG